MSPVASTSGARRAAVEGAGRVADLFMTWSKAASVSDLNQRLGTLADALEHAIVVCDAEVASTARNTQSAARGAEIEPVAAALARSRRDQVINQAEMNLVMLRQQLTGQRVPLDTTVIDRIRAVASLPRRADPLVGAVRR